MITKIGFAECSTCIIAVIIYSEMIEIASFIGWENFQSTKRPIDCKEYIINAAFLVNAKNQKFLFYCFLGVSKSSCIKKGLQYLIKH